MGYNLNFILSQTFLNKHILLKDIDAFGRKIKLQTHFGSQQTDKNDIQQKFHASNNTWEPCNTHHTVSTTAKHKRHELKQTWGKGSERLTDIVICNADKGGTTVIVDVKDYINEDTFSDDKFYKKTTYKSNLYSFATDQQHI